MNREDAKTYWKALLVPTAARYVDPDYPTSARALGRADAAFELIWDRAFGEGQKYATAKINRRLADLITSAGLLDDEHDDHDY